MIVLSDIGDILSPNHAPLTTAPAVIAGFTPSPAPTPIIAIPTVPRVPHEVPMITDMIQHMTNVSARKNLGVISFNPATKMVGTVPAAINDAIIMPTARMIAAGAIHFCAISYAKPSISEKL